MCDNDKIIFIFSKAWESLLENAVLSNVCWIVCNLGSLPVMNVHDD